jgi:hypothetical protein
MSIRDVMCGTIPCGKIGFWKFPFAGMTQERESRLLAILMR